MILDPRSITPLEDGSSISPFLIKPPVGLRPNDVIIAINNQSVNNYFDYLDIFESININSIIEIKILRDGLEKNLNLTKNTN